jgi:CDP-diacylglycerol--serine O-phosphatidyltransferase
MVRRLRRRHRILQATAILPSLATIFNGLSGFGAIHFATKDKLGEATPENLLIAAGLVFAAMLFDMLDGRLARMTRRTSDFGAQLDSLCDAISFGVTPAVIMLHTVITILHNDPLKENLALERVIWCVAAVYVACATLRLARFNVENEPDESAHMNFHGLPSPGAAAAVVSLVILYAWMEFNHPLAGAWQFLTAAGVLSGITLLAALLMVSRFRYPHVVNQYIRGKRSFAYLVKLVIVVIAACIAPVVTIAAVTVGFALSGPIGAIWRLWHPGKHKAES